MAFNAWGSREAETITRVNVSPARSSATSSNGCDTMHALDSIQVLVGQVLLMASTTYLFMATNYSWPSITYSWLGPNGSDAMHCSGASGFRLHLRRPLVASPSNRPSRAVSYTTHHNMHVETQSCPMPTSA
jgi:hypothetical protein